MASVIGSKKCDARLDRLGWTPAGPEKGARNRQTDCAQSNAGKLQDRRRAAMARRQLIVCEKRTEGRGAIARLGAAPPERPFALDSAQWNSGSVQGRRRAATARRNRVAVRQGRAAALHRPIASLASLCRCDLLESQPARV